MEVSRDPSDAFQEQQVSRQFAGYYCQLFYIHFPVFSLGFGLRSSSGELLGGFERAVLFNPELATAQEGLVGACGGMAQMKGLYKGSSFS